MDKNDFFQWTQIPATFPIDIPGHQPLMNSSLDMNFYNPRSNFDYSLDQNYQFESALSSMVSSPAASVTQAAVCGGDRVKLVELVGKMGSISSPSEIDVSPHSYILKNHYQSSNNSSYSTPANSPPKLNRTSMADHIQIIEKFPSLTPLSTDPCFAERAARLSCFGSLSHNKSFQSQRLVNATSTGHQERTDHIQPNGLLEKRSNSKEESSASQKLQSNDRNLKKRKSISRSKGKTTSTVSKRTKVEECEQKEDSKAPEPPKDYIHVRARRGQATDSHSLAERVRREKISERMKFLQDLVPGCNKVTGKAVMLDEIINYVQSLQRQVECLSMKLATVNPMMDSAEMEALLSKKILHSCVAMESSTSGTPSFPYAYQSPCERNGTNEAHLLRMSINGYSNSASEVSMWEDELHNVVRMGFVAGSMEEHRMKTEP